MRFRNAFLLLIGLTLLLPLRSNAAKRYWVASGAAKWNNVSNWSSSTGGPNGFSVPSASDTAYFDGNGLGNDTLDMNITVRRIEIGSGYTGKFIQRTYSITTTTFSMAGGIFIGGSANITCTGAYSLSGGAFTSTSGTLTAEANLSITGTSTFTHNSGTVSLSKTMTLTISNTGGTTFYKLAFAPILNNATYTITSTTTITISNDLIYGGTVSRAITVNTGTINVTGNLTITNTSNAGGGNANIILNGSANNTLTGSGVGNGGRLSNVQINKSGGTLALSSTISVLGNWVYTNGTVSSGTSVLYFIGTKTISGTHTLNSAAFVGGYTYTIPAADTLTLNGYFSTGGGTPMNLNTGTLVAKGNFTLHNTSGTAAGTATIRIRGNRNQSLAGISISAGQGALPHVIIEKTDSTLTLSGVVTINGNFTYVSGTVEPGTSTMVFKGNNNLDGQGASGTMPFNNVTIFGNTRTLTGNLDVNSNLVINSACVLSAGSNTINVGNWTNNGTWTYGTSTVIFDGSGYKGISRSSGAETFYNLSLNRTSGSLKLYCPVNVSGVFAISNGKLNTTTTNFLNLASTASVSGGSNTAYVNGPMKKTGNTAFVFPVGDSTLSTPYHPLGISAPANATDAYIAQYNGTGQSTGTALASTITSVNNCEYWTIQRSFPASGATTITPTLNWNSVCPNVNYADMVVASWSGTLWSDLGAASVTMGSPQGSIAATSTISFTDNTTVVPVLIAKETVVQSYATLSKQPAPGYYNTNGDILYFRYDEEYKDGDGFINYEVRNVATDTAVTLFSNPTTLNVPVVYGTNSFKMDLYTAANTPLAAGMYLLIVTNDKNESFQLMFNKN